MNLTRAVRPQSNWHPPRVFTHIKGKKVHVDRPLSPERQKLVEDNIGLAYGIANSQFGRVPRQFCEERDAQALMALCEAADRWKPKLSEFSTFSYSWIRGRLLSWCEAQEKQYAKQFKIMPKCDGCDDDLDAFVVDPSEPVEIAEKDPQIEKMLAVINSLDRRRRAMMKHRFGLNGYKPLTSRQVAEKFGVRIRRFNQIENRVKQILREALS